VYIRMLMHRVLQTAALCLYGYISGFGWDGHHFLILNSIK
jgi:hypothetical protein